MNKLFIIIIILSSSWIHVISQDSMTLRVSEIDITDKQIGDTLYISVFCDDASDVIMGWQIYLLFDEDVVRYISLDYKQPDMSGDDWFDNSLGYMWAANWLDPTFKGVGLYPGEKLFELSFAYLGGQTDITWGKEAINEEGLLIKGETMVANSKVKPFKLNLINGCICKKSN